MRGHKGKNLNPGNVHISTSEWLPFSVRPSSALNPSTAVRILTLVFSQLFNRTHQINVHVNVASVSCENIVKYDRCLLIQLKIVFCLRNSDFDKFRVVPSTQRNSYILKAFLNVELKSKPEEVLKPSCCQPSNPLTFLLLQWWWKYEGGGLPLPSLIWHLACYYSIRKCLSTAVRAAAMSSRRERDGEESSWEDW